MKKIGLFIVCCLVAHLGFSQTVSEPSLGPGSASSSDMVSKSYVSGLSTRLELDLLGKSGSAFSLPKDDFSSDDYKENYDGTPFFNDEWEEAFIVLPSGDSVCLMMKYLVCGQVFWVRDDGGEVKELKSSFKFDHIKLEDHIFEYNTYNDGGSLKNEPMEVLYSGEKSRLSALYSCTLKLGKASDGYIEATKNKFLKNQRLYYKIGNTIFKPVPTAKKDFFAIFGDKDDAIKSYFNSNKLKLKDEDIMKVFAYYETL